MNSEKGTFCRICEPNCPLRAEFDGQGKLVALKPDLNHPSGGKPCNKGIAFLDLHNDPDRLNWPQKRHNARTGYNGKEHSQIERVGWNQALSDIADQLKTLQQQYGNDAVGVYTGNPLAFDVRGMLVGYSLPAALGTKMSFSAGTQDCNNKNFTTAAMYGATSHFIPDLKNTDYFLCLGANPKASHWTLVSVPNDSGKILKDIKTRGGKVVFVNPRRIESSSEETGETLQIKPDTDVYFLAALSYEVHRLGGFDEERLDQYGKHVEAYKRFIADWPAEKVAEITGIAAETIKQVARDMVAAKSAACYMSTGVNQGRQGNLCCWLLEMLNFATGNLGREGGTYKGTGVVDPMPTPIVSGYFSSPDGELPLSGACANALPAVLLADLIEQGKVRALVCLAGNPLLSMGGEERLRQAFRKLDLLVCVDINPNATTELADYVLPATDWLEREDVNTAPLAIGSQLIPYVQYTEAMEPPAEERKTDWWIVSRLLQEMGLPSQLDDPEHREGFQTVDGILSIKGLSVEQLRQTEQQLVRLEELPKESVFERSMLHDDGKVDCYPVAFTEAGLFDRCNAIWDDLNEEAATLKLIGMRTTHMHNSWMANVPTLRKGYLSDNCLRMCAEDAASHDLFDGDLVRAFNSNGHVECRVEVRDDMRPGVVAMTHGYGHAQALGLTVASARPGTNCNRLLPTGPKTYEPLSYMSWMSGIPVEVEKLVEQV